MRNFQRKTHILILLFCVTTAFTLLRQNVSAQAVLTSDLLNLKAQNPSLTIPYDIIKVAEAWNRIKNSMQPLSQVILGVVDTDFQTNHPEFEGVDIGRSPISTVVMNEAHGTAVMGVIGANNLSATQILPSDSSQMNGILSGATTNYILGFRKIINFRRDELESALNSLVDGGAGIINMSLGHVLETALTPEQRSDDRFAGKQIGQTEFGKYANFFNDYFSKRSDILFTVATGNQNVDVANHTPGGQANKQNTIAVGATTIVDGRIEGIFGSNFGSGVALVAPGEQVYAPTGFIIPLELDDYWNPSGRSGRFFGGTSASAPMVTGVAGLLKAIKPELTPAQIKQILTESADPITASTTEEIDKKLGSACNDGRPGFRGCRLNSEKAVGHPLVLNCVPPPPPPPCILSGTISSDTTISSQSVCVVQGAFSVPLGRILTVEPGVVMKFESASSGLFIDGVLNAQGSTSSPIIFTSIKDDTAGGDTNNDLGATTPTFADWRHIVIRPGGIATISYATIRFGGNFPNSIQRAGILMLGGALSLSNSHITQNDGVGVLVQAGTATIFSTEIDNSVTGIEFFDTVYADQLNIHDHLLFGIRGVGTLNLTNSDFQVNGLDTIAPGFGAIALNADTDFTHFGNTAVNNRVNGIIMEAEVTSDRIWTKDNIPYVVSSRVGENTVIVATGTTLTIEPGVVVKFLFDISRILVYGILDANGTASQPIFFTSLRDDSVGGDTNNDLAVTVPVAGDWNQIGSEAGGTINISHGIIRFGGNSIPAFPLVRPAASLATFGGHIFLSNTHLTKNASTNIRVEDGTATITSSEIDNSTLGIQHVDGIVNVSQSNVHDNSSFGILNSASVSTNAENNFWGDSSGPFHPTLNSGGLGNAVSDNVDFIPFLTTDPVVSLP